MSQVHNRVIKKSETLIYLHAFNLRNLIIVFLFYFLCISGAIYIADDTSIFFTFKLVIIEFLLLLLLFDLTMYDLFINTNKQILLSFDEIIINKKKYCKSEVTGVYVKTGAYGRATVSYRIGIILNNKKWWGNRKPLIAVSNKKEARLIGQNLADFLQRDLVDMIIDMKNDGNMSKW